MHVPAGDWSTGTAALHRLRLGYGTETNQGAHPLLHGLPGVGTLVHGRMTVRAKLPKA